MMTYVIGRHWSHPESLSTANHARIITTYTQQIYASYLPYHHERTQLHNQLYNLGVKSTRPQSDNLECTVPVHILVLFLLVIRPYIYAAYFDFHIHIYIYNDCQPISIHFTPKSTPGHRCPVVGCHRPYTPDLCLRCIWDMWSAPTNPNRSHAAPHRRRHIGLVATSPIQIGAGPQMTTTGYQVMEWGI